MSARSQYPLHGLKVLDFSRVIAGPYATRLLSDLGAQVLKVEPPEGDVTRKLAARKSGTSGMYIQQNIGKRNICIDLKADGARELVLDLARQADIVVQNFRPGVMEKFGIGWDDLSAVNPRLIMLSISGYGQSGPDRKKAAYAPVLQAETGMIARQAQWSGGQTVDLQLAVADSYTSLHGVIAILTALRVRDTTGAGQHIDLPMLSVLHSVDDYAHWALDGLWPKPEENSVWDAPEQRQILIVGDMKWLWLVLSTKGGLSDPTPEGADVPSKVRLRREAMAAHFAGFADFAALTAQLDRLNLAWGEVNPFDARVYDQPSAQHLGVTVAITDDAGQPRRTIQSPWRFSAAPTGLCGDEQIAATGADNHTALRDWLGLEAAAVEALLAKGVLRA